MLVYVYNAALYCEECGDKIREDLTAKGEAPADPDDEGSYDSGDFPKGPTEEGDSDSPSHCDGCGEFLESSLTDEGVDGVLETLERVLRGDQKVSDAVEQWVDRYEGSDVRISLGALAESGLTIREVVKALAAHEREVKRLRDDIGRAQGALDVALATKRNRAGMLHARAILDESVR